MKEIAVRPLKAIRLKCLDCSGWSAPEVENCAHKMCVLYHLRRGKKPKGMAYSKMTASEYEDRIKRG